MRDGCLWLSVPIPITNILIHRFTNFPYKGENPAKEFGGKSKEKELEDKIKTKFALIKKSLGYPIQSIQDQAMQFSAKILVGKIMRKCHTD